MRSFIVAGLAILMTTAVSAQDTPSVADLRDALKINPASTAALAELEALAEDGNARAAVYAANAYRGGLGAERDFDQAFALAARAAELGNSSGLLVQGDIIRQKGRGSDAAIAQARPFWDQAAALGNPGALARLAQVDAPALVALIQGALSSKGFNTGVADGVIGPKTLSAMTGYCAEAEIAEACASGELVASPVLRALARSGLFNSN